MSNLITCTGCAHAYDDRYESCPKCGRNNPFVKCLLCGTEEVYSEGYCAGCYYAIKGIR